MLVTKARFDGVSIEVPPEMEGGEPGEVLIVYDGGRDESRALSRALDFAGKAPTLRSAEDIASQLREERESWGDR